MYTIHVYMKYRYVKQQKISHLKLTTVEDAALKINLTKYMHFAFSLQLIVTTRKILTNFTSATTLALRSEQRQHGGQRENAEHVREGHRDEHDSRELGEEAGDGEEHEETRAQS